MMRTSFFSVGATLAAVGLTGVFLFQQSQSAPATDGSPIRGETKPAQVLPNGDSDFDRVVLTERATQRLAIATATVKVATPAQARQASGRTVIPYAAVIYDAHGDTWTYTNPEAFVYVRHPITVDYIDQDFAVLNSGPPPDMKVVTVGAAELFGVEFGVGK